MNPQTTPQTPTATLRYASVCSGIEAVSLGWEPLGLQAAWFSEIDPFACAVLAHRYPAVPNLGDMTRIAGEIRAGRIEAPDILVGGPPCQAFSIAGNRQGLTDPRGALTLSYVELANVIDQTRLEHHQPPATLVFENVPGLLSDRANAFGHLLGALAGESHALEPPGPRWTHAGCVSGPRRRLAWRVLDAQHFGVAQRRKRIFLVASGRDDLDPTEVLFERESMRGDSSPGFAPWQEAALAAGSGTAPAGSYGGLNQPYDKATVTIAFGGGNTAGPMDVAACLTAQVGTKGDFEADTLLVQSVAGNVTHALNTANNGKGCSEDGTGRGVPIIAFIAQGSGADAMTERSPALRTRVVPAIAFAQNSRGELRLESGHGQVTGALSTGGGKPGQGMPMVFSVSLRGRAEGLAAELSGYEAHFSYEPNDPGAGDWLQWRVRRLLPVECERLQGMPDGWTQVPYRGKSAADAPRYKAIGNSMAVPCVAWLGRRLLHTLDNTGRTTVY